MLYQYKDSSMSKLDRTSFMEEEIFERKHLQQALKENIDIVAEDCLVLAEEFSFSDWSNSSRRIDILAIDKDADLVVIELKRDDTGRHMELQAIRYAAMVSTLTYKKVVKIYQKYLDKENLEVDAESTLLDFLEWEEPNEEEFALDVRLVLVSANFSQELTTSVLWLNERNLDIRCVRLIPYIFNRNTFIDVQQIIPLPEADDYQVRLREKEQEKRQANKSNDYTKYMFENNIYNKRRLVLAVLQNWIQNHKPSSIDILTKSFPQDLARNGLFMDYNEANNLAERQGRSRHFLDDYEVISFNDSSKYAISNQWGKDTLERFIDYAKSHGYQIEAIK